ncbi:hypothetical protein GBF38_020006 [Nibea albiflora]|uniref:Uncharacterized protein n=1 Tax=Nibea albiflora TaxID=240163 RepID=A0ACB7FD21_NIBAL|nr:hypothetical protein GBF38_020006 [Nibea albiflora]
MIYLSKLKHQQFRRHTERITKLKSENEALAAEMEQLKEPLHIHKALHDETEQKKMDKVSEVEGLCKVQEMEETLQRQKESRAEESMLLAQQTEDIT